MVRRNSRQLRYYFGEVVPKIRKRFEELGHQLSKDDTHEWLKKTFNEGNSTEELSPDGFVAYVEEIKMYAAAVLHINILDVGQTNFK